MARVTGLEPATSGVTGRHSNQLSYTRVSKKISEQAHELRFRVFEVKQLWLYRCKKFTVVDTWLNEAIVTLAKR